MTDREEWETRPIDGALKQAVLNRVGRTAGDVQITTEHWDLGFCETCSYPEEGFAVYVDDEQIWPAIAIDAGLGGCVFGDDEGWIRGNQLTTWGSFFAWLDNKKGWDSHD